MLSSLELKLKRFFSTPFRLPNSAQEWLTVLGCLFGFGLGLALILTGAAAIPFGGVLPFWLGASIFMVLITGSFGSAGKYIGFSLDSLRSNEPWTNEKLLTLLGCAAGLALAIAAIPFDFALVDFIAKYAAIPAWEISLIFFPFMTGRLGSACSYIGRSIDTLTNKKLLVDYLISAIELFLEKDKVLKHAFKNRNVITREKRLSSPSVSLSSSSSSFSEENSDSSDKANLLEEVKEKKQEMQAEDPNLVKLSPPSGVVIRQTINQYLRQRQSSLFDTGRGKKRAITYRFLINNAKTDFQRAVVLYSILAGADGVDFKERISECLGYGKNVAAARTAYAMLIANTVHVHAEKVDADLYQAVKEKEIEKAYIQERKTLTWTKTMQVLWDDKAKEAMKESEGVRSKIPTDPELKEKAYLKALRRKVITPFFRGINNGQASNHAEMKTAFSHFQRLTS